MKTNLFTKAQSVFTNFAKKRVLRGRHVASFIFFYLKKIAFKGLFWGFLRKFEGFFHKYRKILLQIHKFRRSFL